MIPGPNWARRYGTQHRRLCARPGCGTPAAATLRFQPTQREAWLVDIDDTASRTEGDLCARHAATLVLPRGWQLHDERSPTRDGVTPPAIPKRSARHASITRARRRHSPRDEVTLPGLIAVPEPEPEPVEPPTPVAEPPAIAIVETSPTGELLDATVTEPVREELAEVLDATTPLLRRAFQNVLPRDDEPTP